MAEPTSPRQEESTMTKEAEEVQEIVESAQECAKTDETQEPNKQNEEMMKENVESPRPAEMKRSSTFKAKEDRNSLSDLKENEKKALSALKEKIEEAIRKNKLVKTDKEKSQGNKTRAEEATEEPKAEEEKEKTGLDEKAEAGKSDISIWGVPLVAGEESDPTDIVLLKFLRSHEFDVEDSFDMLKNTLKWRMENKIDSILEEEFGCEFSSMAYMEGTDREEHPICYNMYSVLGDDEDLHQKMFGSEENCKRFLRWRVQMMEREIRKLSFENGGISTFLQINDLKNSPMPSKKEMRQAMKQAVTLLQDNYPEFVSTNIFINVPFWYYAWYALFFPFLTQRTKSKFVVARAAKVTETLLMYIDAEDIPIRYGGFKRENDNEFSEENSRILELIVKAGLAESVEIPAPEIGTTILWDLTVLGWEVNYKEEFVPTDEQSYTLIVQKQRKMGSHEEAVRNSFTNKEPGKVVLTIENATFKKKKVLFRYKVKSTC